MSGLGGNFGRAVFALGVNRPEFSAQLQASEREAGQAATAIDKPLSSVGANFAAALGERARTVARILSDTEERAQQSANKIAEFVNRIEREAPLRGFQSQLSSAESATTRAATIIDRTLAGTGKNIGDGFAQGVREVDAQLTKAETRTREATGVIGREFQNFKTTLGQGLLLGGGIGIATGAIDAIRSGFDFVSQSIFGYGSQVQNASILLKGFTGSQAQATDALALARHESDLGRGAFEQLANAIAILQPASKQSGESIKELIRLTEILAASNTGPEGGIEGATVALREAASGDFTSLAERFNFSRSSIAKLKDEGVPNIEIVRRQLDQLGIGFGLVEERSRGVEALTTRLRALAQSLVFSAGGADVFGTFNIGLQKSIDLLSRPEVKQGAADFGRNIASGIKDAESALSSPAFTEGMRGILAFTGGTLAAEAKTAADGLGVLIDAVGLLGSTAAPVVAVTNSLGDALGKLGGAIPGSGTGAANTIGRFFEGFERFNVLNLAINTLALFRDEVRKVNDELERQDKIGLGQRLLSGIIGSGPAQQLADRFATPTPAPVRATVPESEGQFDITARADAAVTKGLADKLAQLDKDVQQAAARAAGAYVRTFTAEQTKQFAEVSDVLRNSLLAAVGGDTAKLNAQQLAQGYALVARAVSEIGTSGAPTAATLAEINATMGAAAGPVQQYLSGIAGLKTAQDDLTDATDRLKAAQAALAITTAEVARANSQAQADVRDAEKERDENARKSAQALSDQRDLIESIGREAADAAQHYRDISDALQEQYASAQKAAQASQAARSAVIDEAQAQLTAASALSREHSEAFRALQQGDVAYWLALNGEIDESTRLIIERYRAEVEGKVAARDAAQDRADNIGAEGRARDLELLTKIRAARAAGNFEEAAALERQRNLERQRFAGREEFARLQAAVANDEVKRATKPVEDAAKAQAVADAEKERAAKKRVDDLQTADRAARASEAAALQAIQDQISANERDAAIDARKFSDRARAAQDRLTEIQNEADAQKRRDDAEVEHQKIIAGIKTRINNETLIAAQGQVNAATLAEQKAKDELQHRKDILTNLEAQIKALDDFYTKYPGLVPPTPGGTPPPTQQSPIPGNVDDPNPNPPVETAPPTGPSWQRTTVSSLQRVASFTPGGIESTRGGGDFLRASLATPDLVPPSPGPSRPIALLDERGHIRPLSIGSRLQEIDGGVRGISLPDRANDRALPALGGPEGIPGGGVIQHFHSALVSFPNMVVSTAELADRVVNKSNRDLRVMLEQLADAGKPTFTR